MKTSQPTKTITQRRDFGRFPLRPAPLLHKTCLLLRPISAGFSNSLCSFVLLCCFVFPRIDHQLWGFWAILNQHCCVTLSCIPPVLCYKSHITLCVLVYRQKCKYLIYKGNPVLWSTKRCECFLLQLENVCSKYLRNISSQSHPYSSKTLCCHL